MPSPSVVSRLFSSRKGVAAFVGVLFGVIYAVGLVVAAVLGKLSWESAWSKLLVVQGSATAAIVALVLGVAHEDAAAKKAGGGTDPTDS